MTHSYPSLFYTRSMKTDFNSYIRDKTVIFGVMKLTTLVWNTEVIHGLMIGANDLIEFTVIY